MAFTGIEVLDHIIAAIIVIVGLTACFSGYRLFKLFLALAGFLITMLIVFTIIFYFITPNLIIASVVASFVGVAGAFGITFLPALGVFFLGSFFGFMLSLIVIALARVDYMQDDDVRDVVMLSLSVCIGFVSLRWKKITVMGGTSVLGSFSVTTGIDHWGNSGFSKIIDRILDYSVSEIHFGGVLLGLIIAFFVLFVAGTLVQYFVTGRVNEVDLSVSGQLPVTVPGFNCCDPYVRLCCKTRGIDRDEVPLLDVVTLED